MEGQRASPLPPVAQVRARHPQALLRLAEEGAPSSVAAALGAATRAALGAADPMAWLPVEIDVEVVEAVAALGPAASLAILEARQRAEMKSALFDGFVEKALRAFSPSPVNMVKRIPDGWGRLFRDAGWITVVSTGRNVAVTRFHRLPAVCVHSAPWMASLPVSLRTLYDLVDATGTVDCRIEDAAEGTALLTFRWR